MVLVGNKCDLQGWTVKTTQPRDVSFFFSIISDKSKFWFSTVIQNVTNTYTKLFDGVIKVLQNFHIFYHHLSN